MVNTDTDKEKLKKVIVEISNAMTRMDAEREFIKEAIAEASDAHEIDKKILRKMARAYHKQNFFEEVAESEMFEEFYNKVLGVSE